MPATTRVRLGQYFATEDVIIAALKEVAERIGHPPRTTEYKLERLKIIRESDTAGALRTLPGYETINRRYGKWDDALVAAGLEPLGGRATGGGGKKNKGRKAPRVTEGMIFDAIREAYAELGDPFTSDAFKKWRIQQAGRDRAAGVFREPPSYDTIWSRYGTWKNAIWAISAIAKKQRRTSTRTSPQPPSLPTMLQPMRRRAARRRRSPRCSTRSRPQRSSSSNARSGSGCNPSSRKRRSGWRCSPSSPNCSPGPRAAPRDPSVASRVSSTNRSGTRARRRHRGSSSSSAPGSEPAAPRRDSSLTAAGPVPRTRGHSPSAAGRARSRTPETRYAQLSAPAPSISAADPPSSTTTAGASRSSSTATESKGTAPAAFHPKPASTGTTPTARTAGASPSPTPGSPTGNSQTPPPAEAPPRSTSRSERAERQKQPDAAQVPSRSQGSVQRRRNQAPTGRARRPRTQPARCTRTRTRPLPAAALRQGRGDRASDGDDRRSPRLHHRGHHKNPTGSLTEPTLKLALPRPWERTLDQGTESRFPAPAGGR